MNRELIITNLSASTEAKETLASEGTIAKAQIPSIKKHCKTLSDDDLVALAERFNVPTEAVESDESAQEDNNVSTMLPEWKPTTQIVDTLGGGQETIETCVGTLHKTEEVTTLDGNMNLQYVFKLANGDNCRTQNKLMDKMFLQDVFTIGDEFTFKSITVSHNVNKRTGVPYRWIEGAILETGDDRFTQTRLKQTKKNLRFATLNKDTQNEIREKSSAVGAKAFIDEFGLLD